MNPLSAPIAAWTDGCCPTRPSQWVIILQAARQAFVQGMQLSSTIAAVVAAGLAILALAMLRDQAAPAPADPGTEVDTAAGTGDRQPEAADGTRR